MKRLLLAGALLAAVAGNASAATVGVVEWNGATFTISYLGAGAGADEYKFNYEADFAGFTNPAHTDYIVGINFKPAAGNLTGYSAATTDAAGTWSYGVDANLSSAGFTATCDSGGVGNDFFCGVVDPYTANPTAGSPKYAWDFTLVITGATPTSDFVSATGLRALFTSGVLQPNENGYFTSLMSETTQGGGGDGEGGGGEGEGGTQAPEPVTLALFGLALAAGATQLRRRNR